MFPRSGLSDDGSRILIGTPVSDGFRRQPVRPALHAPGLDRRRRSSWRPAATVGVLFDGMTADGSRVFFTSSQALAGSDGDTAADLYEALVAPGGAVTLRLVSVAADSAACNPVANGPAPTGTRSARPPTAARSRSAAVPASRRQSGTAYFLSPEALGGAAVANQPNLYAAAADGSAPRFVATLSPDDPVVIGSVHDADASEGPEFQVAPSGRFATFRSVGALTGVDNAGLRSVFLFDEPPRAAA